jgi:hypothetical protein
MAFKSILKVSSTRLAGKKYCVAMEYNFDSSPEIIWSEFSIAGIK